MAEGRSDSPLERAMRRHTWWRFHEIATQATRHLRLSAWETSFILSLVELGAQTDGDTELSDKQLKVLLRLEDRVRVQQLLDLARGDPRLTAWEEGFLTNLANSPAEPSEKQAKVLLRILRQIHDAGEQLRGRAATGGNRCCRGACTETAKCHASLISDAAVPPRSIFTP